MQAKELIKQLKCMNPNAEVMILSEMDDDRGYQTVFDCEEEYSDLVTIGCGYTEDKGQPRGRNNA